MHQEPEPFEDDAIDDLGEERAEDAVVVEDGIVVERAEPPAAVAAAEPPSSEPAAPFRVTQRPDGGLSIDVPPGLAEPLAGLLASLAQALRGSNPPS
jgi:hypothetical protein